MSIFRTPTNAYQNPKIAGMRIPTSMFGKVVPVIYGTQRLAWNLIWYGDFTSVPASQVQGGKGGITGPSGKGQSYVYYSAMAAALCVGPIQNIGNVWDSQGILLIQTGAQTVTVPSSGPYTVTVTPPGSGSYAADIGSSRTDAYSVVANDYGSPGAITYAGNQQTPLVNVASNGAASDPFSGSALSPNWTVLAGPFTVGSGLCQTSNAGYSYAYWNANSFSADQAVTVVAGTIAGAGGHLGCAVRMASSGQTYYGFGCSDGVWVQYKFVAGVYTQLNTGSHTLAVDDVLELDITGTTLTAKINGTVVASGGDSSIASGQPGIGGRFPYSTSNAISSWSASGVAPGPGQYSVSIMPGPPQTATYTFNAADAGKTVEIVYSWQDPSQVTNAKNDPSSVLNLTLFTGVQGQAPWGYLTTNHPSQALGYTLLAYLASPKLYLGPSGELPGFTFEIVGKEVFGGSIVDSNPYDCTSDMLMDPTFGLQWTPADLDLGNIGGTWETWSNYCVANSIFISLLLDSQSDAASIVNRILEETNAEMVCSGPVVKMVSYGDTTAVGNGAQFTPDTQPVVDFNDDDFVNDEETGKDSSKDPVEMTIPAQVDAFNDFFVEYLNRAQSYDSNIVEDKDDASIATIGVRTAPPVSMHDVTTQQTAALIASILKQNSVYKRAQYKFIVKSRYRYLEPMDLVTLPNAVVGLGIDPAGTTARTPVRILTIEEDEKWNLSITAEEFPWGTAAPTLYPKQTGGVAVINTAADPGDVNTPIILEANNRVTRQNGYQLWIAVSGENLAAWGGCHVWMSLDGTTYKQIEDINGSTAINGPSRMGVLATNLGLGVGDPDTLLAAIGNIVRTGGTTVTVTSTITLTFDWLVGDIVSVPDPLTGVYSQLPIATVSGTHFTVAFPGTNGSNATAMTVYHGVEVDLTQSGAELQSGTQADADNDRTLCAIISAGATELISYQTADLQSQSDYDLIYLRRGQLTSVAAAHIAGDAFVRIDSSVFQYPFDPSLIGSTLHFKFTSFNTANQMEQGIPEVADYTVTLLGSFRGVTDLNLGTNLSTTGSVPPTFSGTIAYTFASGSVTFTWTNLLVYRPDGTNTPVPNGSVAVTGLTNGTQYFFYPFYDEVSEIVNFAGGGVGSSALGAIAWAALTTGYPEVPVQKQNLSNQVPLSSGGIPVTPTSGGGSGHGGGTGGCPRKDMLVETPQGVISIGDLGIGDRILGPSGWLKVLKVITMECAPFIRVTFSNGEQIDTSPSHQWRAFSRGKWQLVYSRDLSLGMLIEDRTNTGLLITRIEAINEEDISIGLELEAPHLHYIGRDHVDVVTHNNVPNK